MQTRRIFSAFEVPDRLMVDTEETRSISPHRTKLPHPRPPSASVDNFSRAAQCARRHDWSEDQTAPYLS